MSEIIVTDKQVDDSWKNQARKEKEELAHGPAPVAPAEASVAPEGEAQPQESIFMQAIVYPMYIATIQHLGLEPDPMTGRRQLNLEAAVTDVMILKNLTEKTQGNLTPEEAKVMQDVVKDVSYGLQQAVMFQQFKAKQDAELLKNASETKS